MDGYQVEWETSPGVWSPPVVCITRDGALAIVAALLGPHVRQMTQVRITVRPMMESVR